MADRVYWGTVQPHDAEALLITSAESPALVKENVQVTMGFLFVNFPKLWVVLSNLISACAIAPVRLAAAIIAVSISLFIIVDQFKFV